MHDTMPPPRSQLLLTDPPELFIHINALIVLVTLGMQLGSNFVAHFVNCLGKVVPAPHSLYLKISKSVFRK